MIKIQIKLSINKKSNNYSPICCFFSISEVDQRTQLMDTEELSVGAPSPVPRKRDHGCDDGPSSLPTGQSTDGSSNSFYQPNQEVMEARPESKVALKRSPYCAFCKNHGKDVALKGHKMFCLHRQSCKSEC